MYPTSCLEFLGIQIDTVAIEFRLPIEVLRIQKLLVLVMSRMKGAFEDFAIVAGFWWPLLPGLCRLVGLSLNVFIVRFPVVLLHLILCVLLLMLLQICVFGRSLYVRTMVVPCGNFAY